MRLYKIAADIRRKMFVVRTMLLMRESCNSFSQSKFHWKLSISSWVCHLSLVSWELWEKLNSQIFRRWIVSLVFLRLVNCLGGGDTFVFGPCRYFIYLECLKMNWFLNYITIYGIDFFIDFYQLMHTQCRENTNICIC